MSGESGKGTYNQRRAALADRVAQALELRKARYSFPDIARSMNVSVGTAFRLVKVGLDDILANQRMVAEQLLTLELESLDSMEQALIASGGARGDLGKVDRILKVKDMRNRLLDLYPKPEDAGGIRNPEEVAAAIRTALGQMHRLTDGSDA